MSSWEKVCSKSCSVVENCQTEVPGFLLSISQGPCVWRRVGVVVCVCRTVCMAIYLAKLIKEVKCKMEGLILITIDCPVTFCYILLIRTIGFAYILRQWRGRC